MEQDLYKVLGVSRTADEKEIKKAYRQIARENHPDLNPDEPESEARFKEASVAFEVLGNAEKRKLYDEFGIDGLRDGFDPEQARQFKQWGSSGGAGGFRGRSQQWSPSDPAFQDLFGSIFGGRSPFDTSDMRDFGGFYTGPATGRDLSAALTLDFLTAVKGGELDLRVMGKSIKVRIPAGAADGDTLRLKGKGGPPPEGAPKDTKPGDLMLQIKVDPHELLERAGLDLYLDLPVTVGEAVLGSKVAVPTPHGDFVVTIPEGVHSGARLRLKEKGVHRGKKKGDFYVIVQIHTPDLVTDEVRDAVTALDEGYSRPVREDLAL